MRCLTAMTDDAGQTVPLRDGMLSANRPASKIIFAGLRRKRTNRSRGASNQVAQAFQPAVRPESLTYSRHASTTVGERLTLTADLVHGSLGSHELRRIDAVSGFLGGHAGLHQGGQLFVTAATSQ